MGKRVSEMTEAEREKECAQRNARRAANPREKREYDRAWRAANREKINERERARRAANREKKNEQQRARYAASREKISEQERARRAANREKTNEQQRARYAANPEKFCAIACAANHKRKASCVAYTKHPATAKQRAALVAPGQVCFYCDEAQAVHVDHHYPIARWTSADLTEQQRAEGPDHFNNLVGACPPCNISKGAQIPDPFVWGGKLAALKRTI